MVVNSNYLCWLADIATGGHARDCQYTRLFTQLMNIPFRWSAGIPLDENRACDGRGLRRKFSKHSGIPVTTIDEEDDAVTVLEVMVALAMRIEADIMHDSEYGDRTHIWFGCMINSLGLSKCMDNDYDESYVYSVIERFLDHQYTEHGQGGLFTTTDPTVNMPTIEIWQQAQIWLIHDIMNK